MASPLDGGPRDALVAHARPRTQRHALLLLRQVKEPCARARARVSSAVGRGRDGDEAPAKDGGVAGLARRVFDLLGRALGRLLELVLGCALAVPAGASGVQGG